MENRFCLSHKLTQPLSDLVNLRRLNDCRKQSKQLTNEGLYYTYLGTKREHVPCKRSERSAFIDWPLCVHFLLWLPMQAWLLSFLRKPTKSLKRRNFSLFWYSSPVKPPNTGCKMDKQYWIVIDQTLLKWFSLIAVNPVAVSAKTAFIF